MRQHYEMKGTTCITECKVYPGVMVGGGVCEFFCSRFVRDGQETDGRHFVECIGIVENKETPKQ